MTTITKHTNEALRDVSTDGALSAFRTVSGEGVNTTSIAVADVDLSLGALSFTTSQTENFKINYINFNFSSAVSQTITITKTTGIANKDEILEIQTLISNTSARFVSIANTVINVDNGEQLKIQVSNSGTPAVTCYTTLSVEEV